MSKRFTITAGPDIATIIEPIPDGVDATEFLRQQIDNCPLCQEARARGEVPVIHSGEELTAMIRPRRNTLYKRPRWRTTKRRR
jgi:hypothetical protein